MNNNLFANFQRVDEDNDNTDSGSYPTIFDLHFTKSNTRRRLGRRTNATASKPGDNFETAPHSASNSDCRTHPINAGTSSSLVPNLPKNSNPLPSAFHQSVGKVEFNRPNYKNVDQCKKNLNYDSVKTPEAKRNFNENILATRKKYPFLVSSSRDKENVVPSENHDEMGKAKVNADEVVNASQNKFKIPLLNHLQQETEPPSLSERKLEGINNIFQPNYLQTNLNDKFRAEIYNTEKKHPFRLPTVTPKSSSLSPEDKTDGNSDSSQDSSMFETAVMSSSRVNFDNPLDLSSHSIQKNVKDVNLDYSATKSDMECTKVNQERQDCPDVPLLNTYNSDTQNDKVANSIPVHVPNVFSAIPNQMSQSTPVARHTTPMISNPPVQQPMLVPPVAHSASHQPIIKTPLALQNQQPTPIKMSNHPPPIYQTSQVTYSQMEKSSNSTPVRPTKTVEHQNNLSSQKQNESTPVFKKPIRVNSYKQSQSSNQNGPQLVQENKREMCQPDSSRTQQAAQPTSILKRSMESNMKDDLIRVNDKYYKVLTILGKGGSSSVYLVQENTDSDFQMMALKVVNLSTITDKCIADGYLNEVEFLHKLQGCPNVIKMFDYEYDTRSKCLYVLMEKGDSDLSKYMKNINEMSTMTNTMIIIIIIKHWNEMLLAVKELHANGIIHSDLKPHNFLFVRGVLKIIDFGIASSIQGDMTSVHKETAAGTLNYMSPEAIRNSSESQSTYRITYKSDIWSLGCILYAMVYGKTPYSHISNTWARMQAIADYGNQINFSPVLESKIPVPPTLLKSLKMCLQKDPSTRPTAVELLNMLETRVTEF